MKNKLLIATEEPEIFEELVRKENLPDLEIIVAMNEAEIPEKIGEVNIVLTNPLVSKDHIHLGKRIEWIQSTFAGIDAFVPPGMRTDYILTNVKDTYGAHMSEYVFAYILMLEKKILYNFQKQKEKRWKREPYPTIQEKTILILGTGSIGKVIAKVAQTFGMRTLGYKTSDTPVEHFDEIYTPSTKNKGFEQADYVVSVLPHTSETYHCVNKETLSFMKESAWLINIGRGSNVDEQALVDAVNSHDIAGAILDVFEVEPLPQESPLWTTENIHISTHISGYIEDNTRLVEIFVDNYKKFHAGETLDYVIDFNKGF